MIDYQKLPSPCFVIEESRLRRNLETISAVAAEAGVEIIIAFKAFAGWALFPVINEYIKGAAASSYSEARLCFEEMGTRAHTYSPAYSEEEIDPIIEMSSHITFNSLSQYNIFSEKIRKSGRKVSAGLRINPEFSRVEQGLYNPCSPGSRLGITAGDLPGKLPGGIEGFHLHALFESDSYALEEILSEVEKKFGHYFPSLKWINLGGGHLITGKEYDREHLVKLLSDFRKRTGLHVILEPGSAFVWETGELVATVEDVVSNQGIDTAILNVSFTAHMPDCLEMPYKPVVLNSVEPGPGRHPFRLGGNSCLSGDFMGDW